VTFIAKPRKANCTKSGADHPIILPFFMLKTMEKMVDSQYLFAYCPRKITEIALHYINAYIEEAVEHN
jgi:hypothetical protein